MDFAEDLLFKTPFLIIIFFLRQVLLCNVARLYLELSNFLPKPQDLGPACSSAGVIDMYTHHSCLLKHSNWNRKEEAWYRRGKQATLVIVGAQ